MIAVAPISTEFRLRASRSTAIRGWTTRPTAEFARGLRRAPVRRGGERVVAFACAVLVCGSASAQTFEPNVDRPGLEYRSIELSSADARVCQKACVDEVVCLAWTYEAPPSTPAKPGRCWLKYGIPRATRKACCTSGVVRSAAGMKIAHAKEAFEKRGLLGTFAQACNEPVSASNQYVVHRAVDGERIQRDVMNSPTERARAYVGEIATEPGPNQLKVDGADRTFRITFTLLTEGKRFRTLLMSWDDGETAVADGRFVEGRWKGTETPWYTKCE